jgi:predicted TPR repeat methyltransferase
VTIPISRFEATYAASEDPWGFATRWYETRKYALTLAALPQPRYHQGFEPGCSIGVLSDQLADRCDHLLAADGAAAAVEQAKARLAGRDHVTVRRLLLPQEWPDGEFDLVVLSELGYYFDAGDLRWLLDRAAETTVAGGNLVAVHWRGETDYPLTGDEVHQAIHDHGAFGHLGGYREPQFQLDTYRRDGRP